MKHLIVILFVFFLLIVLYSLYFLLHRTKLDFQMVGSFETDMTFRLPNGDPYDPKGWIWYSISENPYTEFDTREIKSYIEDKRIVLNFKTHTYIIVRGYALSDISICYWFSEPIDKELRKFTGIVTLNINCAPNCINIYSIEKKYVVQCDVEREKMPLIKIQK